MMAISAALVVTSNEASKRMEVDYVEFNVDATTGCSLSEQSIFLSTKGQIISKWFFGVFDFLQYTN